MKKLKLFSIFALLLTVSQGAWATGELTGVFSVSSTQKVVFSQGNLRATTTNGGSTWTWSFATNQWDKVGAAAANTSITSNKTVSTNGTVDLFGWSTNETYLGINQTNSNNAEFEGSFVEWGNHTDVIAGIGTGWRTLTGAQWDYLFNSRTTTSGLRFCKAKVSDCFGVILLPDDWSSSYQDLANCNETTGRNFADNTINNKFTIEEWTNNLAAHGAVFLPCAGQRNGGNVVNAPNGQVHYWSATKGTTDTGASANANHAKVDGNGVVPNTGAGRSNGFSVRLVKNVYTVSYNANGGTGSVASQNKVTNIDLTLASEGFTRAGYTLDGWATAADGAKVYDLGDTYTANADVTLYAHWKEDRAVLNDNEEIDYTNFKGTGINLTSGTHDVTINRTLKAGNWNTFTSPVDIDAARISALGITQVKELTDAAIDGTTLNLTFSDAASISKCKPYLVMVDADVTVGDFDNVEVSDNIAISVFTNISFVGVFSRFQIPFNKEEVLFLSSGNTLKHPSADGQYINGFRAFFVLTGASSVKSFNINLGDEVATGIVSVEGEELVADDDVYYDLQGRKIDGVPTVKGIYIVNGKKVVIK